MRTPVHGLSIRSRKNHKVRVPEYTFPLLPLNLVQFGFCTNLVQFRIFSLDKVVERTARLETLNP